VNIITRTRVGMALVIAGTIVPLAGTQEIAAGPACKLVHASLVEERVTVGCRPEHPFCFLGEVTGNHGLRGSTYFKGDSSGTRPPASPDFLPYSGVFEYHTGNGTLIARETGVTNTSQGKPGSGAVTAFQEIIDATGELAGTTGHFFVSGFNRGGRIETSVTGEICVP
jgi:hypothetical protein